MSIGNFEDDLAKLKDCDLIIEAVVENLDIKRVCTRRLNSTGGRVQSSVPTRAAFPSASWPQAVQRIFAHTSSGSTFLIRPAIYISSK